MVSNIYDHSPEAVYEVSYMPIGHNDMSVGGKVHIECVIRCDVNVWSNSGLTLTIHPALCRTSVLIRHRLSDRGSGCWITIEHDLPSHNDGDMVSSSGKEHGESSVISVAILRGGPKGTVNTAKDKHVVWINGNKVKVDVEELKEEEVRELKAKKRIRNRALLLDQPMSFQQSLHRPRSSLTIDKEDVPPVAASPTIRPLMAAIESKPQPPMYYALEALSWLQALHADLEMSDFFSDASEWSILTYAENNSPLRISKRTIPKLSSSQSLFRVERTFPGVSADQVMGIVSSTSTSSRIGWDDRLTSIEPIANYRHCCTTNAWISKASFPLRSRIAYVANGRAQFLVPAASGSSKGTSAISLFASASFPLEGLDMNGENDEVAAASKSGLDKEKLNPAKLTEGKVYLEGWILETVEATTDRDDDEGPSTLHYTRCSFYTCSDLPTFSSGTFGLGNVRTRLSTLFDSLEKSLRRTTSTLLVHNPMPALQIEGSLQRHDGKDEKWQIVSTSSHSVVVSTEPEVAIFIIPALRLPKVEADAQKKALDTKEQSRLTISNLSHTSAKNLPALRDVNSSPSLSRHRSNSLLASGDTLIADIVLTRSTAISGYDVTAIASTLEEQALPVPSDSASWHARVLLPIKLEVFPMTLPAAHASRYLLRLTLPTTKYTGLLEHPLARQASKPHLPVWCSKMVQHETLLRLSITPVKIEMHIDGRPVSPVMLTFNGSPVAMAIDAVSMAVMERYEDEEEKLEAVKISRCVTTHYRATRIQN